MIKNELGVDVAGEITDNETKRLQELCPDPDETKQLRCILTNPLAKKLVAEVRARATSDNPEPVVDPLDPTVKATVKFPRTARRVLGVPNLRRLPRRVTLFLVDEDWVAIQRMCKTLDADATLYCISKNGGAVDHMVRRRIVMAVLALMDVEIPPALSVEQIDGLVNACDPQREPWAKCTVEHGLHSETCTASELALSSCLVDNPVVGETYLKVAGTKHAIFGDALYVEFSGLLAGMTTKVTRQIRKDCAQPDVAGVVACMNEHAVAGQQLKGFREYAAVLAKRAAANKVTLDVTLYTAKISNVLMQTPLHTIRFLMVGCEKSNPRYAAPKTIADVDDAIACARSASFKDPVANPAYSTAAQLERWIGRAKPNVIATLIKQEEHTQERTLGRIWMLLMIVAGAGFIGVMCLPMFLAKQYPNQSGLLWKSSAVGAVTLVLSVGLLGLSLSAMRIAQGAIAPESTPKLRVAHGVFNALESPVLLKGFSELSQSGLDFFKTPIKRIAHAKDQRARAGFGVLPAYLSNYWVSQLSTPQMKRLIVAVPGNSAKNIDKLKSNAGVFESTIGIYKRVDWIMALTPILFALLAVFCYLVPLRRSLIDSASAAASGEGSAQGAIMAELKSAAPFIGALVLLVPIMGMLLAYAVGPVVEMLMVSSVLSVFYIAASEVSTFALFVGMISVLLLLLLCLATYLLALMVALGTLRKVFRARFHHGVSLASFRRLWTWGPLSLLLVLVIPLIYSVAVNFAYHRHVASAAMPIKGTHLLVVPVFSLLLFPVVFWAARGLAALKFIMTYPVPTAPS